jgi:hypothetical protein
MNRQKNCNLMKLPSRNPGRPEMQRTSRAERAHDRACTFEKSAVAQSVRISNSVNDRERRRIERHDPSWSPIEMPLPRAQSAARIRVRPEG